MAEVLGAPDLGFRSERTSDAHYYGRDYYGTITAYIHVGSQGPGPCIASNPRRRRRREQASPVHLGHAVVFRTFQEEYSRS